MVLSEQQLERYSRQLVLDSIGVDGQVKLLNSKVLIVGVGGLASSLLLCLAASGLGNIGLVDFDKVESSNLNRQTIHTISDIGRTKVLSAKEKIKEINPEAKVFTCEEKFDKNNAVKLLQDYDVVVDCLDSFKDKFLLNEFCVSLKKKFVHAGVVGFEGQVLVVEPNKSACLRCFFPDDEPADLRQSCKEIGVLGSCVSVLSSIQASEVIKLLLGIGEPLLNRVCKYEMLKGKFYEFKIPGINKNCPVCSVPVSSLL